MFGKQHAHVMRDIDGILANPNLDRLIESKAYKGGQEGTTAHADAHPGIPLNERGWFRNSNYLDEQDKPRRCFTMTRDGFMLLVMGWNGAKALRLKIEYIDAFNAMEAALRAQTLSQPTGIEIANMIVSGLREALAPLAVRFDNQDRAIDRVEQRIDRLDDNVKSIELAIRSKRRNVTKQTTAQVCRDTATLGGRCPCCGTSRVIDENGMRSTFSEVDHFYQNSYPNIDHVWLICKPCHTDLTTGRVPRHQREAEFRAYQNKRCRIPGNQVHLF